MGDGAGLTTLVRHDEAIKQVLLADDLILTKVDIVGASALHAARAAAQELNPRATLLRVKGLLRAEDEPGPVVVQAVQHVVYPTYSMARWPGEDRASRVMVITRGMSAALVEELRASLDGLLSGPSELR